MALALLAACGGEPDLASGNLPAVGRGPATATLLRVPRGGGLARLYRVPGLDASSWKMQDKLPPLERLVGAERVTIFERPNMGVEDFGFYLTHVPGAFYSLGVRNEARGIVHPVHNDHFDVDEECLAFGAALQALNALAVLARQDLPS